MSFPQRLKAHVQKILSRAKAFLGNVSRMAADGVEELRLRVGPVANRLLERIPGGKRHKVLITTAGILALVLVLLVGASLVPRESSVEPPAPVVSARRNIIPSDELFLPFEPDFVPGVILGREQRTEWTIEDVEPYWQDPLRDGEQQWRERIERTIDDLMESIP